MDGKGAVQKGAEGETAFCHWLNEAGLGYLHVSQNKDVFSRLFQGAVKRPDFLVLLDSIGLLAVDVKNRALSGGVYTLEYDNEIKNVINFERLFRVPVWYTFANNGDFSQWLWINALRAIEVGEIRMRNEDKVQFLAIKKEYFTPIKRNSDLGKLWTQRMPSLEKLCAETV